MSGYTIIDVDTHVTETPTCGPVACPPGCVRPYRASTPTPRGGRVGLG